MAKVWENINGRCYCYGHLAPDRGCDGANCKRCCYNLGKIGSVSTELTLAQYLALPDGLSVSVDEIPLEDHIKSIYSISVERIEKFLEPEGENRKIIIKSDIGAVFTLTIEDSSGCSILEKEMENFQMTNATFSFNQKFPAIKGGLASETYSINAVPAADTSIRKYKAVYNDGGDGPARLFQYPDPTVTITNTSSQTGPVLAIAGSDVTKTGRASTYTGGLPSYTSSTYTLIVTESGGESSGYFYVKGNPKFNDNITSSTLIKKVVKRDDINDRSAINTSDCLQSAPAVSDGTTVSNSYTEEVKGGAKWKGEVSYTKTVFSSLEATDGTKINDCNDATDKFKLENTEKLFEGMIVTGASNSKYINDRVIKTWDNEVTLSSKHIIRSGTVLTFKHKETGAIGDNTTLPHNTIIEIENSRSTVRGNMKISGSGSNTLTVTTVINVLKFGTEDVTHTLDLDNFIVRTPNAYDQTVIVKKDTPIKINMILKDIDSNAKSKVLSTQINPSNGTISAYDADLNTITYTPHTGFTGEDSFTFVTTDLTTTSDEKTIFITVK